MAYYGGLLRDIFCRTQTVEARHEHIGKGIREGRWWSSSANLMYTCWGRRGNQCLRELFDVQRVAFRPFQNGLFISRPNCFAAGDRGYQCLRLCIRELVHLADSDMRRSEAIKLNETDPLQHLGFGRRVHP